jgi:hypothetical protein
VYVVDRHILSVKRWLTRSSPYLDKDLKACNEWLSPRDIASIFSAVTNVEVILPEFSVDDFHAVKDDPDYPLGVWPQ